MLRHALALGRQLEAEGKRVRWLVSGRKGASTLALPQASRCSRPGPASPTGRRTPTRRRSRTGVAELYVDEEVDRVVLVYNHFVSPLVQQVVEQDVLPIPEQVLEAGEETERARRALLGDFIYEPEPEQILERLLPVYVETELYRALLESAASEQGARMTAMRNASKNAGELIDTLTLAMNRARQAEITQEILEVVAGRRRAHAVSGLTNKERPPASISTQATALSFADTPWPPNRQRKRSQPAPQSEAPSPRRSRPSREPSSASSSNRFAHAATGSRSGGGSGATGSRSPAGSSSSCSSCRVRRRADRRAPPRSRARTTSCRRGRHGHGCCRSGRGRTCRRRRTRARRAPPDRRSSSSAATATLGRDEFLRLLYGAQVSLEVAIGATLLGDARSAS